MLCDLSQSGYVVGDSFLYASDACVEFVPLHCNRGWEIIVAFDELHCVVVGFCIEFAILNQILNNFVSSCLHTESEMEHFLSASTTSLATNSVSFCLSVPILSIGSNVDITP